MLVATITVAAFAVSAQDRAMVPVTVDGEQVKLATITYKPAGSGPFPILICRRVEGVADRKVSTTKA